MNVLSSCKIRTFFVISVIFLSLFGFQACKSIGPIEVEQDKYELPGSTVVDTLNVKTNEYTYYHLSTDQPWVLVDTQTVYNANQQITFVVLENPEGVIRNAKIIIVGEDLTPKEVEIIQQPGGPGGQGGEFSDTMSSQGQYENSYDNNSYDNNYQEDNAYVETKRRSRKRRRIKTESAYVEVPTDKTDISTDNEPVKESLVEAPQEEEKSTLEVSSDQVNLGAADELESDEISIKANVKWELINKEDWLSVIDDNGNDVKEGTNAQVIKIKTIKPNTALTPRKSQIIIQSTGEGMKKGDSILKQVITVTQKATEAKIALDKTALTFGGEAANAKDVVNIEALGTNFTITKVPAWLKVSPLSGKIGTNEIEIKAADDNTTSEQRKAVLTVSSTGNVIQKELTVTQDFIPSPIEVSELSGNLERDKESIQTFTITASKDWVIKVPENVKWFTVDVSSGKADEEEVTITITSTEENTGLPRKAALEVVSGKFKRRVVVIQEGDQEGDAVEEAAPVETQEESAPTEAPKQTTPEQVEPSETVVNPEFTITSGGILAGEFTSYVLLGNPKMAEEDPSTTPASITLKITTNQDFIIDNEPFDNSDTFYSVIINQNKYTNKDTIKKGKDIVITFRANSDNIQKKEGSKVNHIQFKTLQGTVIKFKDAVNNQEQLEKLEIKQEAYKFKRPYVKVYGLDFDGYNSSLVLGNPGSKGEDALPTTVTVNVEVNTNFALTLLLEGDERRKNSQYNIFYANVKNPNKRYSYKMGDKLDPGEYTFTINVKKNYVDPQGVGSRYTESFIFNIVEGKTLTPYEFVDMDNYSVDLSYFRELFLVEQESFEGEK